MEKNYIELPTLSGIRKVFTFTASHNGNFKNKKHVDNTKHQHKFKVILRCKSKELNDENVVIDFRYIEDLKQKLEGQYLNELFNEKAVTVEYLARYICENVSKCFLCEVFEFNVKGDVTVPEGEENMAWYYKKLTEY